ncbi:MAG: hypothetical protein HXN67_07675 [Prevotella pallens]|nr:hypothetical protein [Prevotella pallens]
MFRCTFRGCSPRNWLSVSSIIAIRQQHFGRPLAAVGADLSRPHIRKHPRNDKRKCACGEMNIHI